MAAGTQAVILIAPQSRGRDECLCSAHCLIFWSFWDPCFLLSRSWQPQLYPDTPRTMFSLLQAEYRLCNGSDKECTSPTTRVSKKDTLKVGLAQGRTERTPTPPTSSFPCALLPIGELGQSMHSMTHVCSGRRHRRRTTDRRRSGPRSSCSVP